MASKTPELLEIEAELQNFMNLVEQVQAQRNKLAKKLQKIIAAQERAERNGKRLNDRFSK